MTPNQLDKIEKILGLEAVQELVALASRSGLEDRIVSANQAMQEAEDELEANPQYQELKENLKALNAGKRDLNKRQRAVIKLCLHLLESAGNE